MPKRSEYAPGVPTWVDHSSQDPAAAAEFYGALFGWEAPEGPAEFAGYRNATKDGQTVAGIGPAMGPGPSFWSTYIATDDAAKTTELVTANGGTVIADAMTVGDNGTMAIYQAPDTAIFGVWQADQHHGAQLVNEHGAFTWNELMTRDVEGAKTFYANVFGWTYEEMDMGPAGTYTVANVGERGIAGIMPMPAEVPPMVPAHWGVYFAVDDCDAAVAKAQELGATVAVPAMDVPTVGRFCLLVDPQGTRFFVIKNATESD